MKKELKAGDWVVCTAQKRPDYFAYGAMDYLLNKGSVSKVDSVYGDTTIMIADEKYDSWLVDPEDFDRAVVMCWTPDGTLWKDKLIAESEFDKEVEKLGLITQQQKESVFYKSWSRFLDEIEGEDDKEEIIKKMINGENMNKKEPIKQEKTLFEEYLETSNKLIEQKIFTHRVINDTINRLLKLRLAMMNRGSYPKFIEDSIEDIYEALRNHRRNM